MGKLQPSLLLFIARKKTIQSVQTTGKVSTGLVSVLSCIPAPARAVEDKTSRALALASNPSDPLHLLSATVRVLVTTSVLLTASGCLPSRKSLPLQLPRL